MKPGTPGPWNYYGIKKDGIIVYEIWGQSGKRVGQITRLADTELIAKTYLLPEIQEWAWQAKGYLEELVDRGQGCDYARDIIKGLEETLAKFKEPWELYKDES